ncbi:MAG: methyltransferase [Gammaproteobacteria bacterium]|nr:methyltransferase [Gammaproteobacteria bacterium]
MNQAVLENKLLQLATGHQLAAALYFVTVNKIPDCLKDGPRTAEDVAAAVGLPARSVYRLLRAMTTSGIFRLQDGRFSLTEISDLLRTDHARSQRSKILLAASDLDVWSRLGEAVELEDAIPDVKKDWYLEWGKDEDPIMIFDKAMRSYYFDAPAPLLGVYDFDSINTLVDIAGGDGGHLIEILKAHPDMKGILYEQPETARRAEGYISEAGLSGRCVCVAGDFFRPESIPDNGDAYMMRNIMHCWADEPCRQILTNIAARMPDTARILVMEQKLPSSDEQLNDCVEHWGVTPAWWDMLMLLWFGGAERTEDEFKTLYEAAGLKLTNVLEGRLGTVVYEGAKASAI